MALALPEDLKNIVGTSVKNGDYEVLGYRASGMRGHVFRAKPKYGAERALKFIPKEKLVAGWEQETLKAHLLEQQPNTVRFHESFWHGNRLRAYAVLVFDFIEGISLRESIRGRKLMVVDVQRVLEDLLFFRRDCLGLSADLRHGDLHPGNIMLRQARMGAPRAYEVMITDFGIGKTGAVLHPKDDFTQIGDIATMMLQSITREHLDQLDRTVYDELCHGIALKKLREHSPVERGREESDIESVLEELSQIRSRAATPELRSTVRARFGDYLVGEQLGSRWGEWRELFVSGFPGYEDIVNQNTTVLTGTRGCGKTMVFRRLSALLSLEVGRVDDGAAGGLVGIYLNMNDVADAFLHDTQRKPNVEMAMRVIQFFHLSLLGEIVRVAGVAYEKASKTAEKEVCGEGNRWLFNFVIEKLGANKLYPGPDLDMRVAGSILEDAKERIRLTKEPIDCLADLGQNDWLKRFVPELQKRLDWVDGRPIHILLDDYSLPRVNDRLQRILNSVIFQRADCFFFKISTESPSTFYRIDLSGKTLEDPHDFELTDLGSLTIDLPVKERKRFLGDVFRRRFARDERFVGLTLGEVLGRFDKSWAELARHIRKEFSEKDAKADTELGKGVLYYGREVFINMWSGDTRSMVGLLQNILEQLPSGGKIELPIDKKLQNKVFRQVGGEFLHRLEACTRTERTERIQVPAHISAWGKHLEKIVEAFKDIALHELRTRKGNRKGRDEPKQAFRIEMLDQFALDGVEKEIYEDLVRHGVFLRDDRGKSIRGAIIPRLYLRRLLIPFCTLTFSKIDNIHMTSEDFRRFLLHPTKFAESRIKERDDKQGKLF